MIQTVFGWELDVRQVGEWLCAKITGQNQDQAEIGELMSRLWTMVENRRVYRLVLELDEVKMLSSFLMGQLIRLEQQLAVQGGVLRLSGLSPHHQEVLELFVSPWDRRFSTYPSREAALGSGVCPPQP